jgi:hypothetical protein
LQKRAIASRCAAERFSPTRPLGSRATGGHLDASVVHQKIEWTDRGFRLLYAPGGLPDVGQISQHHLRGWPALSKLVAVLLATPSGDRRAPAVRLSRRAHARDGDPSRRRLRSAARSLHAGRPHNHASPRRLATRQWLSPVLVSSSRNPRAVFLGRALIREDLRLVDERGRGTSNPAGLHLPGARAGRRGRDDAHRRRSDLRTVADRRDAIPRAAPRLA